MTSPIPVSGTADAGPPVAETAPGRSLIRVGGPDRESFLQGLVSNDLRKLRGDGDGALVYAALLSPQGKYLADFLLVPDGDAVLLDVAAPLAEGLLRRLSLYRLRAAVTLAPDPRGVVRGLGPTPPGAFPDPRHPGLGWRAYDGRPAGAPTTGWDALRVAHVIPETGIELIPDESYILECGFERLNGVDFRKGCYVGQEVTARMKHKTELRKGLVAVQLDGRAAPGTPVITAEGKDAGVLHTVAGTAGLAHLRFDRTDGPLTAGAARIRLLDPAAAPGETPG